MEQAEHKIQSKGGSSGLSLTLDGVPKTLGTLRHSWAPRSFVVSFKLETDPAMLHKKAEESLDKSVPNCMLWVLAKVNGERGWVLCYLVHSFRLPRLRHALVGGRYGMNVVVANLLSRLNDEVYLHYNDKVRSRIVMQRVSCVVSLAHGGVGASKPSCGVTCRVVASCLLFAQDRTVETLKASAGPCLEDVLISRLVAAHSAHVSARK